MGTFKIWVLKFLRLIRSFHNFEHYTLACLPTCTKSQSKFKPIFKLLYFWYIKIKIKYLVGEIFKYLEIYEFLDKGQKFRLYHSNLFTWSGRNSVLLLGDMI